MDFFDSVRVLLRRWYVVLLGAALTGGAAFYAIAVVPTNYQAHAQYVLLLPAAPGRDAINPYLNLNGGLTFAASLIASDVGTEAAAREMVEAGFTSAYTIGQSTGAGPVLEVNVSGTDQVGVLATRDAVLARFDEELFNLQKLPGIPSHQKIFSRTNAVDPAAEAVPGAKKKALLLIAALGGALTLLTAFTVDGLFRRRANDRKPHAADRADPLDQDPFGMTEVKTVDIEKARSQRDTVQVKMVPARTRSQNANPVSSAREPSSGSPPEQQHSSIARRRERG